MLDRLGVLKDVDAAGAQPLAGMRIIAPDGTALDRPRTRPRDAWRGYRDHALAVERERLRPRSSSSARAALPVDVRERHRAVDLVLEGRQVTGVRGRRRRRAALRDRGAASSSARTGASRSWRARSASCGRIASQRMALIRDVEGLDGFDRPRRDLRGPARLLDPESRHAGQRQPEPRRPPRPRAPLIAGGSSHSSRRALKQLRHLWPRLSGHASRGPADGDGPARLPRGRAAPWRRGPRRRRRRLLRSVHRRGPLHRPPLGRDARRGRPRRAPPRTTSPRVRWRPTRAARRSAFSRQGNASPGPCSLVISPPSPSPTCTAHTLARQPTAPPRRSWASSATSFPRANCSAPRSPVIRPLTPGRLREGKARSPRACDRQPCGERRQRRRYSGDGQTSACGGRNSLRTC